ncbi:MAG: flagellar protein FliT [Gammaproteobacteria bacterium]|nr:flagellar protein FliT [Gammaproteobacteria bacterium]
MPRPLDIPHQRSRQWATITQLSGEMLSAAKAGEWERVAELDAQRSVIIQTFFQQTVSLTESAVVGVGIQRILEQDQETQALGREQQQCLMNELGSLGKNKRAVAAYGANQS